MGNAAPAGPGQPNTPRHAGKLFLAFLRLGLSAFGGPAMVAYIKDLAVQKNAWVSEESFKQGVAICQLIPGATAMQVAAYVGLRASGPLGAIAAYAGFAIPAFLLMVVLTALYQRAHDLPAVISIFQGLQVIVIALLANATVGFGQSTIKKWQDIILGLGITAYLLMHGSPVLAILASAICGLFLSKNQQTSSGKAPTPDSSPLLAPLTTPILLTLAYLAGLALLYCTSRQLFELSLVMAKVDLLAFGGGYGSVPLMFDEVVGVRQWLAGKTFMDGIALGQVTPGPIVITATFVGYLMASLPGALVGTLSIFTPSLIMLTAAVPYFDRIRHNGLFQRGMHGILVSFVGLLLSVTIRFILTLSWGVPQILLVTLAFLALRMKVDILWVVFAGGILSWLFL
ncbi:MAG: chromate efflux transporter [Desulforhopalus sp.]|nr:chromate efflux transporter [Desulforhopalus sp.]